MLQETSAAQGCRVEAKSVRLRISAIFSVQLRLTPELYFRSTLTPNSSGPVYTVRTKFQNFLRSYVEGVYTTQNGAYERNSVFSGWP